MPLVVQLLDCVRRLHRASIVHGDLSMENILLTRCGPGGELAPRIIDFGMSSRSRFRSDFVGKSCYQAPEMHGGAVYDGFQALPPRTRAVAPMPFQR